EDYRVHGPEQVAVSFFGANWQGSDCSPVAEITAFLDQPPTSAPADTDLLPLWNYVAARHPREHRMTDKLGEEYAVIWLTRKEFDGSLTLPPMALNTRYLARNQAPEWLFVGAAAAYYEYTAGDALDTPDEPKRWFYEAFNGRPRRGATDYAIRWTKRANDPNAGKIPPDGWLDEPVTKDGYLRRYGKDYHVFDWARDHKPNHIGGTMDPVQAHPPGFTPYYVEFEETFGGHN